MVNEVKVYITNEAVVNCQPQNCSPHCKNNRRIMLKSYKYFEDGREMVELGQNSTALLFATCSNKRTCNITSIENIQQYPNGYLYLQYSCVGKTRAGDNISYTIACAPSEDSDLWLPLSDLRRLWSDYADMQADLSLRWVYMQSCR